MTCYTWPPPRRSKRLAVAIPGSILVTEDTLELKTVKAGIVGRVLAIHRVDEVVLYKDRETTGGDLRLLRLLLEYMTTPPHLRRKVHPLRRELKASGLLPPLRTCNHEVPEELRPGDKLDSYIESCEEGVCKAYLGRAGYGILRGYYKPGSIVTVRVKRVGGEEFEVEESSWGNLYTGFKIKTISDLEVLVESYRRRGYTIILSSKYGDCSPKALRTLEELKNKSKGLLVIFGGPYRCPYEYTKHDIYDVILNTIPNQGTLTVRTEEAMIATLTTIDLVGKASGELG
jgi:predicted SPOUT superfamily RNA methylase MTH1